MLASRGESRNWFGRSSCRVRPNDIPLNLILDDCESCDVASTLSVPLVRSSYSAHNTSLLFATARIRSPRRIKDEKQTCADFHICTNPPDSSVS